MSHNPNETTEHIVSNMINWSDKVIKSQHELNTCNDGKRSSDVVLSAVEKCERLQKQLDIAVGTLRCYGNPNNWDENRFTNFFATWQLARDNLDKIEELNK